MCERVHHKAYYERITGCIIPRIKWCCTFSHKAVEGSSTEENVMSVVDRDLNRSTTLALMSVMCVCERVCQRECVRGCVEGMLEGGWRVCRKV